VFIDANGVKFERLISDTPELITPKSINEINGDLPLEDNCFQDTLI